MWKNVDCAATMTTFIEKQTKQSFTESKIAELTFLRNSRFISFS